MIPEATSATQASFTIEPDAKAEEWLRRHPSDEALVIAFEQHKCCYGRGVCDVRMRPGHPGERFRHELLRIGTTGGREVLLDVRIAGRMPRRIPLTVGGVGPFRGLRLDLTGPEWGVLLYS